MTGSNLRRLDKLLVERGLASSREEAKELIAGGRVSVSGFLQGKAASLFSPDAAIAVERDGVGAAGPKWVSRGAYKLLKGLDEWQIDVAGLTCTDIGASTGGFTQVLLSRGASRVAAVDVGYGQLAWQLRNDARVRVLERTNARYLTVEEVGWEADLLTVDASFISLRLLLPNLQKLVAKNGIIIVLIKPQFEVGRARAGKGVVRDQEVHLEVLRGLAAFVSAETGLYLAGATYSPIRGPEGNIEFIFYLKKERSREAEVLDAFQSIVAEAHERSR